MNTVRNSLFKQTKKCIARTKLRGFKLISVIAVSSFLIACSDNDGVAKVGYEVEIVNLTHNQPFSPLALRAHGANFKAWRIGEPASLGIEYIAEAGDNTEFLGRASSKKSATGTGIIGPGETALIDLGSKETDQYLTAVTMLVNTNDAFAGVTGFDLSDLAVGDKTEVYLPIYDSGTEANDELAGTIPGPADSGAGFNAERNDVDYVAMHPGVVGLDDGYSDSVLNSSHKFDGPAAKLMVTRIK